METTDEIECPHCGFADCEHAGDEWRNRMARLLAENTEQARRIAELEADAKRLQAIQDNSWRVICENSPTGGDDYEIAWYVYANEGDGNDCVIGCNERDNLRAAIDAATSGRG